ncbi:unnamed protein product [Diatraea saccharalis]|uniref:Uncharacterized protein n=1 Tax=Diatraea saccharalis TaxID=40085 RepID=A0A9N9QTE7_9NEOP|nr:unnamed protein product [Diatraea saccharalis]
MVEDKMAKANTGSEVIIFDEKAMVAHAAREMPNIASVHVSKSSKVHIGPKIVAVSQTVENKEMIKDLPLPKYIWTLLKNTNKTERLSCLAAMVALAVCITLIIFYTVYGKNKEEPVLDTAPHEWKISRDMWLAQEHLENSLPDEFKPVKLVVVQHTAGSECYTFDTCATELRNLQGYFLTNLRYDIPYTFLIGNDGRVYEGRGWNQEGAHTYGYNRCSVGIGFMGDYRGEMAVHTKVTPKQIQNMMQILQEGVNKGYIVPDYSIVAALDLRPTKSPGSIIYKALQQLDHFDNGTQFANRNCSQIHGYIK